jgi:cytochrome b561
LSAPAHRYSSVAIVLHWTIAVLILLNLYIALKFDGMRGLALFKAYQLHKSIGLTVLILSLARLGWRLTHRAPQLPSDMPRWERLAAGATHWAFYGFMIGIPLTGWVIVSASPTNIPTLLWNKIPWPHLEFVHNLAMPARKALEDNMAEVHEILGFTMLALIVLHMAAALKHQFFNRDEVLGHMLPFARPKKPSETL